MYGSVTFDKYTTKMMETEVQGVVESRLLYRRCELSSVLLGVRRSGRYSESSKSVKQRWVRRIPPKLWWKCLKSCRLDLYDMAKIAR